MKSITIYNKPVHKAVAGEFLGGTDRTPTCLSKLNSSF